MITTDTLYLLKADFKDSTRGKRRYFCRECVEAGGLLETYPQLRQHVRIQYVDFPRPRPELVPLLGEENQGCPVLVLGASPSSDLPLHLNVRRAKGNVFVAGVEDIEAYFAHAYGIGVPY